MKSKAIAFYKNNGNSYKYKANSNNVYYILIKKANIVKTASFLIEKRIQQ